MISVPADLYLFVCISLIADVCSYLFRDLPIGQREMNQQ